MGLHRCLLCIFRLLYVEHPSGPARIRRELAPDNLFFASLPYYAVACAVFVSLFVGTEYADGTLRNKIIVGHARWEVYLSTYLVCLVGDLVILSGWLAGELTGIFYFGFWQAPAHQLFLTAGCLVLMSAALTGLLVLLSLSFTNRDVTAVGAVLLATALLMTASLLYNRLSEPKINSASVVVHENGQMEQLPPPPTLIIWTDGSERLPCGSWMSFPLGRPCTWQRMAHCLIQPGRPPLRWLW